jgi:hypothetical protein
VLRFGTQVHRTGVIFFFLRKRDIPIADRSNSRYAAKEGTVVLLTGDAEVITVYRNRSAYQGIRKKLKYRLT